MMSIVDVLFFGIITSGGMSATPPTGVVIKGVELWHPKPLVSCVCWVRPQAGGTVANDMMCKGEDGEQIRFTVTGGYRL